MNSLLDRLREPSLEGFDVDSEARLLQHRAILEGKPMIRDVFRDFHRLLSALAQRHLDGAGIAIELGAGVMPMRESHPDVLATDVVPAPHLDAVIDAQRMSLRDGSVRVVYAQNAFHHFPAPARFFAELERVLSPGGGAILLEPYYGPVASFVYRRLFRTEGFDKASPAWETPVAGPMNGANQALSYIVFVRDRAQFASRFPTLQIVHQQPVDSYLRYLVSGGLNFRQLLPDAFIPVLRLFERGLTPLHRMLALHHVVVLRKIGP
jgi:SAM-dependent methyltransferase